MKNFIDKALKFNVVTSTSQDILKQISSNCFTQMIEMYLQTGYLQITYCASHQKSLFQLSGSKKFGLFLLEHFSGFLCCFVSYFSTGLFLTLRLFCRDLGLTLDIRGATENVFLGTKCTDYLSDEWSLWVSKLAKAKVFYIEYYASAAEVSLERLVLEVIWLRSVSNWWLWDLRMSFSSSSSSRCCAKVVDSRVLAFNSVLSTFTSSLTTFTCALNPHKIINLKIPRCQNHRLTRMLTSVSRCLQGWNEAATLRKISNPFAPLKPIFSVLILLKQVNDLR